MRRIVSVVGWLLVACGSVWFVLDQTVNPRDLNHIIVINKSGKTMSETK